MQLREYRRQSKWAIVLRVLGAGLGLVLTYALLYLVAWHNVASMSSGPPSPDAVRVRYIYFGMIVASVVAVLFLALGPQAARAFSPVLGYVPVVIYAIIAIGLLLLLGTYEASLLVVALAALAWWLRR